MEGGYGWHLKCDQMVQAVHNLVCKETVSSSLPASVSSLGSICTVVGSVSNAVMITAKDIRTQARVNTISKRLRYSR